MTWEPPAYMFSRYINLPYYLTGALAVISVTLAIRVWFSGTRKSLPPGPKPLPLIGNLLDLPSSEEWLTWQSYVKRYGDLVYLTALGNHYLLLGSHEAITDLLEKRTSYNSRANPVLTGELMDNRSWNIGFLPYGSHWRLGRKIMHSQTHAIAAASYEPIQLHGARRFVGDLLAAELLRPNDKLSEAAKSVLPRLIRRNFTFTTVHMIYGINAYDSNAEARYVDVPEKFSHIVSEGITPGRFLVDFFPILKYVPAWLPGAGFQRFASEGKALGKQMRDDPMAFVKTQLAAGKTPESMAAHMLSAFPQDEQVVSDMAGTIYIAGSDTTVAAVTSFFLAMTIYPNIQWKVQQELDRVVGRDRLPEFADKDKLPYLQAVMRECIRWLPVTPQGLAHFIEQDDEYRGFYIPKNTIVLPFQWGILHDENTFPQPSEFLPERYLTCGHDNTWELRTDVADPRTYAFGFGRRVCPGKYIAEQTLFATLSTVIHTLDVVRAKNSLGQEVVSEARMNSGLLCHPIPFAYELRIRKDAQHLVKMCAAMVEK